MVQTILGEIARNSTSTEKQLVMEQNQSIKQETGTSLYMGILKELRMVMLPIIV